MVSKLACRKDAAPLMGAMVGKLRTFIFGNLRLNVYICELET